MPAAIRRRSLAQDERPIIAWYGDDFTGAAAVMEVLTFSGLPAILFLDVPSDEQLARFPGIRAIGVASTARARSPDWMDATLPDAFATLAEMRPQILHYKICSTLDSSPEVGSIGRAIEIGADLAGASVVPVLVAAPQMRRYQAFGHLFAGIGADVVRLDRHPVMARHPVTPMNESDVSLHISRQSGRIDARKLTLEGLTRVETLRAAAGQVPEGRIAVVSIDCMDATSEAAAGRALWHERGFCPFVVGSQGVEYALVAHLRAAGQLSTPVPAKGIGRAKRMVSVSGSVSPTTADQIAWSREHGFACLEFDATRVCRDANDMDQEVERVASAALRAIDEGRDPLIHTAAGPEDAAVQRFRAAVAAAGLDGAEANQRVGQALGRVLKQVLDRSGATRAVVSGGDTSGFATMELGIFALSALAPTIPGASIFRAHAEGPRDGLELALKGGQMGSPDYFGWVRDGGGPR